jgi:hypothetical protein
MLLEALSPREPLVTLYSTQSELSVVTVPRPSTILVSTEAAPCSILYSTRCETSVSDGLISTVRFLENAGRGKQREEKGVAEIRTGKERMDTKHGMGKVRKPQDNGGQKCTYPPRAAI